MDKDQVKGSIDDAKGRIKRQVGEWTGDESAQAEGTMDQAKGKVEKAWGNLKEGARDLKEDVRDGSRGENDIRTDEDEEKIA